MRRTNVYIDGFNLYHAIDELDDPRLKWLDLRALAESLLRDDESLNDVKYFSAFATWKPASVAKHRIYVSALRSRGVLPIMGQFKNKPQSCRSCRSRWMGHEEKETDVQIAIHMVADALSGEAERLILISADTDLAPPIRMLAERTPACELFVATPPGRFDQCRALGPALALTRGRLQSCRLPDILTTDSGREVSCPPSWR